MIVKLNKSYKSIYGTPVIHSVDTDIFDITYFMKCMECNFCKDQCCDWGADIDMLNVARIMKYKESLETFTGIRSEKWFDYTAKAWDHEYPGGDYIRTTLDEEKNSCVFLNKKSRGCMLHSFALRSGIDYHEIKPFFCSLFPVTYYEGVLVTPEEIDEGLTACLGEGFSLYRGAREEIRYYFGDEIIRELDEIEFSHLQKKKSA
ncbi:MAG: DUF3109 family protein [Ignavibacteria bacterium]|nr:DUF3109 family protein [Ignavibacteria bacterium]